MSARVRRAGVVSQWGLGNFGNRLQNYAVNALLERRGYETWTLLASPHLYLTINPMTLARRARRALRRSELEKRRLRRFRQFEGTMRRKHFYSPQHLARTRDQFDCFVVGSDQIWNPFDVPPDGHQFLDWARREQRIALAPSFGISRLPEHFNQAYSVGLNGFERLSVRERAGADIIANLTGREAEVLIDPTLALTAAEWRSVACGALTPKSPYALTYFLGDCPQVHQSRIQRVTESRGIPVVSLLDISDRTTYEAGPAEFLDLVDHAECVFTDSFHGSVFALLFGVPLVIFERTGGADDASSMHSRIETFTTTFDLEARLIRDDMTVDAFNCDYTDANRLLDIKRSQFLNYVDDELKRVSGIVTPESPPE